MRRRTPKRVAQERVYLKRSREWLEGRSCARCGTTRGLTVQHLRGRRGALLLDERYWLPLCWEPCHRMATENPTWALENGLAQRRVGAA